MMPPSGNRPYVGLHPAMPQYDAGRVIEPPVCEPSAPRHMPVATAAAEPLDEPPGVRARFHGFRVTGGSKLAYCVVTVLPRKIAPASRSDATTSASCRAMLLAHSFEPARGRPIEDVEDVLDADRDAVQRPAILALRQLVGQPFRLGQGVFAIDEHPGVDVLLPAVDGGEALLDEIDRRDAAGRDRLGGFVDGLHNLPDRVPVRSQS